MILTGCLDDILYINEKHLMLPLKMQKNVYKKFKNNA